MCLQLHFFTIVYSFWCSFRCNYIRHLNVRQERCWFDNLVIFWCSETLLGYHKRTPCLVLTENLDYVKRNFSSITFAPQLSLCVFRWDSDLNLQHEIWVLLDINRTHSSADLYFLVCLQPSRKKKKKRKKNKMKGGKAQIRTGEDQSRLRHDGRRALNRCGECWGVKAKTAAGCRQKVR